VAAATAKLVRNARKIAMDDYEAIEARYHFRLPPLYRVMQTAGYFDYTRRDKYIEFTDHLWKSLQAIARHEFCPWQTHSQTFLVPFSHSARRDEWGWRLDWVSGDEPAIVFCERGPEGKGYAPDFCGFLYRMLLEEFSGSWVVESPEDDEGKAKIRRAVQAICPHLPGAWSKRIDELSRQHWYRDKGGAIRVYPRGECNHIIEQDLAFPHLNEVFQQETGA
jgi:hypothetical protein